MQIVGFLVWQLICRYKCIKYAKVCFKNTVIGCGKLQTDKYFEIRKSFIYTVNACFKHKRTLIDIQDVLVKIAPLERRQIENTILFEVLIVLNLLNFLVNNISDM